MAAAADRRRRLQCPANYLMIGLTGRIGSGGSGLNDEIAAVCAPLAGGATVNTASVGSNFSGSIAYTTVCPDGLAVAGLQGGAWEPGRSNTDQVSVTADG